MLGHRRVALNSCDRHWSGTECAERKRGRNERDKSVAVPKTNWNSVTFLPKLNPKEGFFSQRKRKEIKVFSIYTSPAKRLVMCFFIIIKKNPQQT